VPAGLAALPPETRPQVRHQSGRGKLEALQTAYRNAGVEADCCEFIDDMVSAYREADLVICRAGALTVAELTAAGLGALLVPYPFAVDDHQTANARFMTEAGAAELLPQPELTAGRLAQILGGFTREQCLQRAQNARRLAKPDSAEQVAAAAVAAAGA